MLYRIASSGGEACWESGVAATVGTFMMSGTRCRCRDFGVYSMNRYIIGSRFR